VACQMQICCSGAVIRSLRCTVVGPSACGGDENFARAHHLAQQRPWKGEPGHAIAGPRPHLVDVGPAEETHTKCPMTVSLQQDQDAEESGVEFQPTTVYGLLPLWSCSAATCKVYTKYLKSSQLSQMFTLLL